MVEHSLVLQNQRDKKERELDTVFEAERINKDQLIRIETEKKTMLVNYQKWKTENNIPGIKY